MLEKVKCDKVAWLASEEWLQPVMKDDMYLQSVDSLITEEDWSDSDEDIEVTSEASELNKVKKQLAEAQAQLALMAQTLYEQTFNKDPKTAQTAPISKVRGYDSYQSDEVLLNSEAIKVYEDVIMNNRRLFEVLHCSMSWCFSCMHDSLSCRAK